KAGAWGYINKSEITEELINALRKITLQKRRYINPEVAQQLATQINDDNHEHLYESLSDREFQTMLLIASGKNVSRIADKLSLSAPTIYTYRRRIKEKTGLKTNVEITRYVMENDLLELSFLSFCFRVLKLSVICTVSSFTLSFMILV